MLRTDVDFISAGTRCAAWLYIPERKAQDQPLPVVIMAHGIGAERTFRLPAFAERFVARGMAVLLFDYRNFGDSAGKPRNLVDPRRHLEDWSAALEHVKTLDGIDPRRIALWGTSFSGGHVLVTAARHSDVSCVVSQVPFVDGLAPGSAFSLRHALRSVAHALVDRMGAACGARPHQVPLVGGPGDFALLIDPEGLTKFEPLLPPDSKWQNRVPARFVLGLPRYRPSRSAKHIRCPVLLLAAADDSLIPVAAVARTAKRISDCEFVVRPMTHFEPYIDEEFEHAVGIEADFLCRHLSPG